MLKGGARRADGGPSIDQPAGPVDRPWLVALAAALAVFAALGLGRFGYSAVLPAMQADLGLSNTQAGALASWNLAAYVAVAAVAGVLVVRFGTRQLVPAGLVIAGVAMVATGLATGFGWASMARALTGVGAGLVNVPAVALTAVWFTARRRGLASGIVVSGSSVGLVVVGPTVPRVLAAFGDDGWRVCWLAFGITTLLCAVVAAFVLRNRPAGSARSPRRRESAHRGGVGRVLGSRFAWSAALVALAFGFSYVIYLTFYVKRLTGDLGVSTQTAGTLFMILGWASLSCGVLWGHVSDVIGRKYALAIVSLTHAVAFALFALWTTTPGLVVSTVLFGFTAWSVPGIVGAACGDAFGPSLAAAALGFVTLFLGIGQALGPLIGGALADSYATFVPAYLLAAGVALVGCVGALGMPAPHTPARVAHAPRPSDQPQGEL